MFYSQKASYGFVKNMKEIKTFLEKHRYGKALVILGLIVLGLVLWILNLPTEKKSIVGPVEIRNPVEERDYLTIIRENPQSSSKEPKGDYLIRLSFDRPVNTESLQFTVNPKIPLAFQAFEHEPSTLTIYPNKIAWTQDIKYTITIRELKGIDGASLGVPIIYNYYYTVPEVTEAGESWMANPNLDPEALRDYLRDHHDYEKVFGEPPPNTSD